MALNDYIPYLSNPIGFVQNNILETLIAAAIAFALGSVFTRNNYSMSGGMRIGIYVVTFLVALAVVPRFI